MRKPRKHISLLILIIGLVFLILAVYNFQTDNYVFPYDGKLIFYIWFGMFLTFVGFYTYRATEKHIKRNWGIFIFSAFIPILLAYLYFQFWELNRGFLFYENGKFTEYDIHRKKYLEFEIYMYFLLFAYLCFNILSQFTLKKVSFWERLLMIFVPFYLFFKELVGEKLNINEQIKVSLNNQDLSLNESKSQLKKLFKNGLIDKEEYDNKIKILSEKYNSQKQQKTELVINDLLFKNEDYKTLKSLLKKKIITDTEFEKKVNIIKQNIIKEND